MSVLDSGGAACNAGLVVSMVSHPLLPLPKAIMYYLLIMPQFMIFLIVRGNLVTLIRMIIAALSSVVLVI